MTRDDAEPRHTPHTDPCTVQGHETGRKDRKARGDLIQDGFLASVARAAREAVGIGAPGHLASLYLLAGIEERARYSTRPRITCGNLPAQSEIKLEVGLGGGLGGGSGHTRRGGLVMGAAAGCSPHHTHTHTHTHLVHGVDGLVEVAEIWRSVSVELDTCLVGEKQMSGSSGGGRVVGRRCNEHPDTRRYVTVRHNGFVWPLEAQVTCCWRRHLVTPPRRATRKT